MANLRALGLDELLRERRRARARPCSASAWACSSPSTPPPEHGGAEGLGLIAGEVRPLRDRRAEAARTSAGTRSSFAKPASPLVRRPAGALRLLPRALARARAHRPRGRASGTAEYGERVRHGRRARLLLRRPVPPREVLGGGPADARQLRGALRRGRSAALRPVMLYPAIDILDGSAVRLVQGDFDASTVYDADPLAAARGLGRGRRRARCTSSTSTARRPAAPVNLEQLRADRRRDRRPGAVRRRPALAPARSRGALERRRRARGDRHRRASPTRELLREALAEHGPERVVVGGRRPRRRRRDPRLAADDRGRGARGARRRCASRACSDFVFTNIDHDGMLDGPDLRARSRERGARGRRRAA